MYEREYVLAFPSGVAGATVTVNANEGNEICRLASMVYGAWAKYLRDIHVPYGLDYSPTIRNDISIAIRFEDGKSITVKGDPVYAVYLIGAAQDEDVKIGVETTPEE